MPSWLMSAVRTAVQAGWGALAAWLLTRGVHVPADAPPWLTAAALAVAAGAVTAVLRWLETRSWRPARRLGRVLMLGIVRQPAAYTARPEWTVGARR